ncbi:hypothetical protein [Clostridium sp. Maddingley MBC34-26]|uniref:hypothetical protein n=1 Tax=Clostridium sp. Maddingley MBC34-26 TaxID=1196322 RepID=UPI0002F2EA6B|nr:hypothetical protein [Clostridium sp. Maddingley MBC34-26]
MSIASVAVVNPILDMDHIKEYSDTNVKNVERLFLIPQIQYGAIQKKRQNYG